MISFAQSRLCTASTLVALALPAAVMAQPTVSNVQFTQQATPTGTEVIITYDLVSPSRPANITLALSKAGGVDSYPFPITTVTGDLVNVTAGTGKSITWAIATDYPNEAIPNARILVTADDGCPEAKNDFVSTNDNTVLNGNVFANNGAGPDVDTGGGTLTVVALNSNGALVGVPTVLASGATLTLNSNGTFSYNPTTSATFNALQVGQQAADSFTYTLTDGTPSCPSVATVNVTINGANDAPVVAGENFQTVGNTTLQVAATQTVDGAVFVVGNLLTNDSDVDGPSALTASFVTQILGASTTVNPNGSFVFTPPVGATSGSFVYSVSDGTTSTNGLVSVSCVGEIWYVQNNAAPGGTGRSLDPFDTLAEAESASSAGDTIYILAGDGSTTGQNAGITLKTNQRLIGQGSPLGAPGTVNDVPNPQLRAAGSPPLLGSAAGNVVTVVPDNTIRGFNIADRPNGAAIRGSIFGTLTADTISISGTGNIFNLSSGTINGSFPSASSSSGGSAVAISAVNGTIDIDGGTISGSVTAPISIGGGNLNFTYSGSVSQSNDAPLVSISGGHTGTLQFDTGTLSATNGTGLQFNNSDGVYSFLGAVTLNGGDAGIDIINGSSGNFSFNNTSITNPSGTAFLVDGGSGSIGHAGTITKNSAGRLVSIQNRVAGSPSSVTLTGNLSSTGAGATGILVQDCTGGTVTFSGSSKVLNTGTSQAVTLTDNAGTTINFTGGGLDIDTASGTGFGASGGATGISVQGTGNTIDSTTGTALRVADTTISSNGLTFQRVSSSGGANVGISLSSTGSLGGLSVTGTGAAASGGTIANKSGSDGSVTAGIGIYLNDTSNVSLNHLQLNDFQNFAIRGTTVRSMTLTNSVISGTNGNNAAFEEGCISLGNYTGGVSGVTGTFTMTNCTVSGGIEDNFHLINHSGNLNATVTGCTIRDNSPASPGNNGMLFQGEGSANMTIDIVSSSFLRNRANGVQAINQSTGTFDIQFGNGLAGTGGTFTDNNIGANIAHNGPGTTLFDVARGSYNATAPGKASPVNINLGGGGDRGPFRGFVRNNTITNADSLTGPGIRVTTNGTDPDLSNVLTIQIEGNNISQIANRGIEMIARDGNSTINATIVSNTVNLASGLAADAVHIAAGATSGPPSDTNTINANIRFNTLFSAGINGLRVRQRFATTTFRLEGYGGPANDIGQVQAFLAANNPLTIDTIVADFGGSGFQNIGSVPTP